jgi:hypothetical protein
MRAALVAAVGVLALLVPAADAVVRVHAVNPGPIPADNGTPACADARSTLRDANAQVARFQRDLAAAKARERRAETAEPAAKSKWSAKPNDAALHRALKAADAELADARLDLARLVKAAKTVQSAIDKLVANAAAQCAPGEPTAADTTDDLVVPADNGTTDCGTYRNQMISLLRQIEQLRANEIRWLEFHPTGTDLYVRAIQSRQRQLKAIAPKAAAACAKIDFTGAWTGTYHESPGTCVSAGKTGPMTMTLTQTEGSLTGTLTDRDYSLGCSNVDLHGQITGTVSGNTATIQTAYDNDAGTYGATLTLKGNTLTFEEESGDSAMLARG